ncbi:MAG TPA: hypothetical protein VLA16_27265, partial [Ideonella sp.]|nr:hypothetical protein [Ideonella sp.]
WWGWNQAARLSALRVSEAQFEKQAVQRNAKAEKEEIVDRARREAQRIEAKARDAEDHAEDVIFKAGLDRMSADLALRRAEQQQASLQRDLARARADRLAAKASSSATTDSDLSLFYAKEAVLLDPALLMPLTPTLLEASRFRRAYARLPFDALGAVDALALSADGQRMLSANGKELSEWRLAPGGGADLQHRLAWPKPPGDVNALAFAPDGRSAAVGTDEGVWLWQTGAGPALLPLEPKLAAKRVKIGSDGQVVVALSNDGRRAAAWAVRDRRQLLSYELPEKDPSLFDVLFSEAGGRLVLVAAPGAADLGARTLVFERTADGFAKAPQVATGPSCKDAGYSYAAGGSQLGVVLAPQLCLHDLRRLGETQAAPSMSEETSVVEDIVFSPDGRYLVKLMRRSNEAQLVDLRGGATLRLQGAFDLPPSTSYEPLLSVSTGGERLAIKGNDGSVRLFDLGASANSLSESGGAVWLSANDEVAVVRTYTDAEAGIEARAMRSNAVLRPLGGKGRYADPRDFVLDADGRSLHFRADCGPAPERGEAPRCIVSQDLRSPAAAPHEQPYTNHLARAETLYLLTDERQWLVYSAAAQAVVFRADPPGTSPKARPRDAASAGIELGNGRSFAVKRTVGGMLKVDVYAVEAGAARLVRSIERPAGSGYTVGFRGQGRALLLASAARSELWDLRSPSNAPAVVVEGRSAGEALVNAETGLVALQAASGPWELRSLEDGRPRGSLPAQFQIEPGAAYAWAQMNGRWQVRALAEPAAVRLEGEGEVSDAQFSRTGGVMAVILQGGGRLRVYSLQTRKPLFETETAMLPGAQLSDAGGYLRDQEGRLVPADSAALLASVQTPSRRTWDGDRERCRLLNDAPACGRAALRPAPVSVP